MFVLWWALAGCGLLLGGGDGDPDTTEGGGTGPGGTGPGGTGPGGTGDVDSDDDGYEASVDCDDADDAVHPGAIEDCDGVDNDCDGLIDGDDPDVVGAELWYLDLDGDGYAGTETITCEQPLGGSAVATDCDDTRIDVSPDAQERCDAAQLDEDCDGLADDLDPSVDSSGFIPWFPDGDADGFGPIGAIPELHCNPVAGASAEEDGDCDDHDPTVYPGAVERCDLTDTDEDCDGLVEDDDPSLDPNSLVDFWPDDDGDGFGDSLASPQQACEPRGAYKVANGDDCDDLDPLISPLGQEVCDPDDADEDCDGLSDDGDPTVLASSLDTWFPDGDGDGFGGPGGGHEACDATAAFPAPSSDDCDDTDPLVSPDAAEVCDDPGDVDEDCDGVAEPCVDIQEVHVAGAIDIADVTLLLDTTCSMASLLDPLTGSAGTVVSAVFGLGSDVTVGVATFDDYAFGGFGEPPDKPFILLAQQSSDFVVARDALASVGLHNGLDTPEAHLEALAQLATGAGYDQDCDGNYDAGDDVRPLIDNPLDAFGGGVPGVYDPAVPGTGDLGGLGFRDETLPVVVMVTDAVWRDPEHGDPGPGGCPRDAGYTTTVAALGDLGARVTSINDTLPSDDIFKDEQRLADDTLATADLDGDGLVEPAVITTAGFLPTDDILDVLLTGVFSSLTYDTVELREESDPFGVVAGLGAPLVGVSAADELVFDVGLAGTLRPGPGAGVVEAELAVVVDGRFVVRRFTIYVDN